MRVIARRLYRTAKLEENTCKNTGTRPQRRVGSDSNNEGVHRLCAYRNISNQKNCRHKNLRIKQQGAVKVAAAFTDHFAVTLRLTLDISCTPRGKGYWRMNASCLSGSTFQQIKLGKVAGT